MNRKELIEMIQAEIHSAVIEMLKRTPKKDVQKTTQENSISEEEIDSVMFFGGEKPKKSIDYNPVTIKESSDNVPKIGKLEVVEFEKKFREKITSATVIFDKQKNGYSIFLTKTPDGVEAFSSGVINVGSDGKIIWSFSILDGIKISTSNFKLNEENKSIIQDAYDFYATWEKDWREKLTTSGGEKENDSGIQPGAQEMGAKSGVAPKVGAAPVNVGLGNFPEV